MDLLHEYLDAGGFGDQDPDDRPYVRGTIGETQFCDDIVLQIHLDDGFTHRVKYILNIELKAFNIESLRQYYTEHNLIYNRNNFSSCNTFTIELRCVGRYNDIFSDHHRSGYIDIFTCLNTGKKMMILAPRYFMYVIEKCVSAINSDKMTCDELQKYILWQENILIKNKRLLYDVCVDRLILREIVTYANVW